MDFRKGRDFIYQNARPLDLALWKYYFENGTKEAVLKELACFQNEDGGFGNGLEPDNWNPNSNPIATNDAVKTLFSIDALDEAGEIVDGIVKYLASHDSFDENRQQWLFAIESTKDYPHAIWWEKQDDGVREYNPTVSLAAVMVCYGNNGDAYKEIIRQGFRCLENTTVSGDALNCFLLCYELLAGHSITDVIALDTAKRLLDKKLEEAICKDIEKYGVEYVSVPSDFLPKAESPFVSASLRPFINAELKVLDKLQHDDGGFDITWQWCTPYSEFEQARRIWRARITVNKLVFERNYLQHQV